MRILANNVLVKCDVNNEITLSTGDKLFLDTRFEEQLSAPQSGTVVAVPEKLTFTTIKGEPGLECKTDMELQVGDRVIFNFNAQEIAKGQGLVIGSDILIRYDMIYVAIRNDQVIVINGGVIVEPIKEMIESTVIIPKIAQGKNSKTIGRVTHASQYPVQQLRSQPELNTLSAPMACLPDGSFGSLGRYVVPGDVVQFSYFNAIPLQHYHELNGTLTKKLLYRMQHQDIEIVTEMAEVAC